MRGSEAEFAQLRTAVDDVYEGPWSKPERLSLAEAGAYIDQVLLRIAAADDEIRRRHEAVDLTCPHCGRRRIYIGKLGFLTGYSRWLSDAPSDLGQQVLYQHAYRCDRCGSTEFFADGFLTHPLPGRDAATKAPEGAP